NPLFLAEGIVLSKGENGNISSKLNYLKLRCGFLSFSTDKEFQKENLKTSLCRELIGTFACRALTMTGFSKMGSHFRS
ncbi:hypothetical protein ACQP3J_31770, partial [Escherichia coli]